jgi:glutamine amidotransferase
MSIKVKVVDYGVGNLLSVARGLERCGAQVEFATTPEEVTRAGMLILPGVGAFADGVRELHARGLDGAIREFARSGKPMLGICLGMQMLLSASEEFGEHEGLDIVPGRVRAIPPTTTQGKAHKIPHIGWSALELPADFASWRGTILEGINPGTTVYFVHSFTAVPAAAGHRLADCHYGGRLISAAVRHEAVSGCQFHPEKSGETGLRILQNFLYARDA